MLTEAILAGLIAATTAASGSTAEDVVIESVSIDGHSLSIPSATGTSSRPLRIPASTREVVFYCRDASLPAAPHPDATTGAAQGEPDTVVRETRLRAPRIRYRLDGHDDEWQDAPAAARASLFFITENNNMIGTESKRMTGASLGWQGDIEGSRFVSHACRAVVPPATSSIQFAFLTDGDEVVGRLGIDDIAVRIERDGEAPVLVPFMPLPVDLASLRPESKLRGWWRPGSRPEMSRLDILQTPQPHAILVISDDDPERFGNWAMIDPQAVAVRPGDHVTLSWRAAYSFGVGGQVTARYSGLRSGRYTFRVSRFLPGGQASGELIALDVIVVPPYYDRWEVWAAAVTVLTSLGVYAGRAVAARRLRQRLQALEQAHALEQERSRIARDLHDEVGAGLTQIAMQVEKIRDSIQGVATAESVGLTDAIWRNAADLVRSVDAIVWAVNPEHDTLDRFVSYLVQSTEEFLEAAGMSMRFDVPRVVPAMPLDGTVRHRLFLAVREALHNAVRHSAGTSVTLTVRIVGGLLEIAVKDDGRGFDATRPPVGTGHDGLVNMRRRMEEIGGSCAINPSPGTGTTVWFRRRVCDDSAGEVQDRE